MTREEAKERVARGAALLDEKRPGWASHVDTGTLKISDCTRCVCGQLGGGTREGYHALAAAIGAVVNGGAYHGFHTSGLQDKASLASNPDWQLLQDAWIEAIADRVVPTSEEPQSVAAVDPQVGITTEGPRA